MSASRQSAGTLNRRDVVAQLMAGRGDTIVVSGLGSSTYDLAAAGDHPRNFYLWGAMGGTAMIALGLAIARPDTPVIALTGDGEMLMGLGSLATIGMQQPKNLKVIVLDNGLYAETGGQATHTQRTDLARLASACGIDDAGSLRTPADVQALAARLHHVGEGPTVAVVKIAAMSADRTLALREGAHNKARLRLALGLTAD